VVSQPDLFPSAPLQEQVNPDEVREQMIGLLVTALAAIESVP